MSEKRYTFPRSLRLTQRAEFDRVYARRLSQTAGPLRVNAAPNGLAHCRLGFSLSGRLGNAVTRHRVRRMLREAFRLRQHDLPGGYDLVISARPHEPQSLEEYQRLLTETVAKLDHRERKRQARNRETC
jgi:ribonuclease P protein component